MTLNLVWRASGDGPPPQQHQQLTDISAKHSTAVENGHGSPITASRMDRETFLLKQNSSSTRFGTGFENEERDETGQPCPSVLLSLSKGEPFL